LLNSLSEEAADDIREDLGDEMRRGWSADKDYLVWIDPGLIIVDLSMKIELIISSYPNSDIIVSKDSFNNEIYSTIDTGFIIVKNCDWTKQFLSAWYISSYLSIFLSIIISIYLIRWDVFDRLPHWDKHIFTKILHYIGISIYYIYNYIH
jgi:hypothetical protein